MIVRITTMILRRRIHITNLIVSTLEPDGLYQLTITIRETGETTRKLMLQLDKQTEVFRTFYDSDPERVQLTAENFRTSMFHKNELETDSVELLHSAAI